MPEEDMKNIINYINKLDYDKYAKDMEIREALQLIKNKMEREAHDKQELTQKVEGTNKVINETEKNKPEQNNEEVQKLNREFRAKDKPTNVLSFANIDDEGFEDEFLSADMIELGDIIMAFETLQNEADIKKISLEDHFAHLLVHGILHLFGYDHQKDEEADEMEDIEINILEKMDIANPYEE